MLDFQTNYSRERLNVDGSLMDKVMTGTIGSLLGQMRNKYEQEILIYNCKIVLHWTRKVP